MKAWFALMFWSTFGHQTSSSACHFSTCKCHCHLWQARCEVSFFFLISLCQYAVWQKTQTYGSTRELNCKFKVGSRYRFFWRVLCYTANILVVIITSWWVVSPYNTTTNPFIFFVNTTNSYFHVQWKQVYWIAYPFLSMFPTLFCTGLQCSFITDSTPIWLWIDMKKSLIINQ